MNSYDTAEWRQLFDSFKKETITEAVVRDHRHCGSHSNILSCCVEFFIKYWRGKMPNSLIGRIYRFLKRWWYHANRHPQYVPCPKCLIKRYARPIYECDWQSESVRSGECKPTGNVIGFSPDPKLPEAEETVRSDRNCGTHSNIPSCCVEFFIKHWWARVSARQTLIGSIYLSLERAWYPADRRPAYVPCPKCLIKRRAQPLHECDGNDCKPTGRVLGFAHEVNVHYRP